VKAIVCEKYGPPDVLQLRETPKPVPKENEALVKIMAASLNAADLETLRGDFVTRMVAPLKPKHRIPGTDFAGQIEAIGSRVMQFKPGDEIWGDLSFPLDGGTLAEYVCIPEKALRLKPASMTFEEAAAIPTAAVVALQKLRIKGPIRSGQMVLINGAGGGVGTFAIQIAKYFGAEVTGVDSTEKLDTLRAIGVDHVIDYTQEDFAQNRQHYDLILDIVVRRSFFDYRRVLNPQGICVMVGGSLRRVLTNKILGSIFPNTGNKKMGLGEWNPNKKEDLDFLQELVEAGKLKPVIDRCYPLSEVPEAFRYLEAGHVRGKAVITMEHSDKF
jgi:NADPH:quinone reductase-like Zn-dependent oxidoreductase